MRALFSILALGLVSTVPAFAAPTGFNQDPLLVIRFDTFTIAGERIDTQAVIHTGGAIEIVDVADGAIPITSRGVASQARFAELKQALTAGRVASERGGCGEPVPDGPVEYQVIWYDRGGARFNTFRVGVNPEGCPARTARMVRAITAVLMDIYTSEDTQVFPSPD